MRAIALILTLLATPVLSLSCGDRDPVAAFGYASQDSAEWMVVYGRLAVDESRLPQREGATAEVDVPARLKGRLLDQRGFNADFDRLITLRISCLDDICAGVSHGQSYLAFLRRDDRRLVGFVDPCNSLLFPRPTRAELNAVQSCMRGACP
ncbi:hypothetical protein [Tropicibacter oceani]|uniref:Lipoprotein n=1 Tax=Tropicibacter oceani TaxID=3058420 RepID=A0ABY8QKI8_9RHOB|nr:hypothetical protein [Tropicibacter oceani]WGW05135.1 hypothetical protein QF118_06220 [Tropicibacter oceani]